MSKTNHVHGTNDNGHLSSDPSSINPQPQSFSDKQQVLNMFDEIFSLAAKRQENPPQVDSRGAQTERNHPSQVGRSGQIGGNIGSRRILPKFSAQHYMDEVVSLTRRDVLEIVARYQNHNSLTLGNRPSNNTSGDSSGNNILNYLANLRKQNISAGDQNSNGMRLHADDSDKKYFPSFGNTGLID